MRILLPGFSFLALLFFVPAGKGQTYLGLAGGGGLPNQVVFRAALPMEVKVKNAFALQGEVSFVQRENLQVLHLLSGNRQYVLPVISYLELPFLAKVALDMKSFNIYGLAGPKVGYATGLASTYWEDNILYREKLSVEEHIQRFDFGLYVGAGVEKVISNGRKIFIEARYYLGLCNISSREEVEVFNEGRSFNLGFKIPLR